MTSANPRSSRATTSSNAPSWRIYLGIACMTLIWFGLLSGRALYEPDEGRYAEIPREMLQNHQWVIPHLDGLAYLEKPPLQYWLTALSYALVGESEFGARLCTGLAGYLSLSIGFLLGRRLWSPAVGARTVLFMAASPLWVLMGHQLTLDMLLSCCLFACLGCYLIAQTNRAHPARRAGWMLGCWAAMALAVIAKGLVGVVIPVSTVLVYALWQRDREALRTLNLRWGLPLFTLIAAPWFVMVARRNPDFLQFFFVREHLARYLTPIEHRTEAWWFFAVVLAIGIWPWVPQALSAAISTLRNSTPRGVFDPVRLLWTWSAFIVVFFSFSDAKLIPYILPAIPALALLCAARPIRAQRASLAPSAWGSLAACIGIAGYASAHWGSADARTLQEQLQPVLLGTAAVLSAAAIASLHLGHERPTAGYAVLFGGWFLASCGVLLAAETAQDLFSAKHLAADLRSLGPAETPVFCIGLYDQSLPFYLGRTVTIVAYQDEFALGLSEEPQRGIATLDEFSARWRRLGAGFAVMWPGTRDALRAQGLPMREIEHTRNRVLVSRR